MPHSSGQLNLVNSQSSNLAISHANSFTDFQSTAPVQSNRMNSSNSNNSTSLHQNTSSSLLPDQKTSSFADFGLSSMSSATNKSNMSSLDSMMSNFSMSSSNTPKRHQPMMSPSFNNVNSNMRPNMVNPNFPNSQMMNPGFTNNQLMNSPSPMMVQQQNFPRQQQPMQQYRQPHMQMHNNPGMQYYGQQNQHMQANTNFSFISQTSGQSKSGDAFSFVQDAMKASKKWGIQRYIPFVS